MKEETTNNNFEVSNLFDLKAQDYAAYYEQLYVQSGGDPWAYMDSAAELRKYEKAMAIGKELVPKCEAVLEIGSSIGFFTCQLAGYAPLVAANDISPAAIGLTQQALDKLENKKGTHFQLITGPAQNKALFQGMKFDLVFMLDIILDLPGAEIRHEVVAAMFDYLKPGGYLIATDYQHPSKGREYDQYFMPHGFKVVQKIGFNDRLWFNIRANMGKAAKSGLGKAILGNRSFAMTLEKLSALRGFNGSKHFCIVAQKPA